MEEGKRTAISFCIPRPLCALISPNGPDKVMPRQLFLYCYDDTWEKLKLVGWTSYEQESPSVMTVAITANLS